MIRVLSIGNSFSQDAQRYLHGIARAEGVDMLCVNLYIGGCSFEKHFQNLTADARAYSLEINGTTDAGFYTSIREALAAKPWDVVTIQQASPLSDHPESYEPYMSALVKAIRETCPGARLLMHETWGYREGSERIAQQGFTTMAAHTAACTAVYRQMEKVAMVDGRIPCGENMVALHEGTQTSVHRDPIHASLGVGRYLLGATFYRAITGQAVTAAYEDFDEPVSASDALLVRKIVNGENI